MRTIFITSFHTLVSRVLQSGVLEALARENLRIVILVPDFKISYFEELFGRYPNVMIEGISKNVLPKRTNFYQDLTLPLLDTKTMRLTRRSFRGYKNPLKRMLAQAIASGFGRFRFVRELFRAVNYYVAGPPAFASVFEKYHPNLVLSMDVKHILDAQLIIEARHRGIKSLSMVRSWDYLTGKGVIRAKPDKLIVHNEVIRDEALQYADMVAGDIFISGLPHYDPYVNSPRTPRDAFFKKIGVSPDKRLILFAPFGDKFADIDADFLDMLGEAIEKRDLPNDLAILSRLPPGDTVDLGTLPKHASIVVDAPGVSFGGRRKENEMSLDDLLRLADSIFWSEVVVTSTSTINIDAAAFDKPTILLAFDGKKKKGYYEGIQHYFDFDHLSKMIRTGSMRLVHSRDELIQAINGYLADPSKDAAGRARLRQEQAYKLDGKSSQRLAAFVLSQLP